MEYLLLDSPEKLSHLSAVKQVVSEQKWEIGQIVDDRYEIQGVIAKDERKIIYKVRHCQWNIHLAVRSQLDKKSQVQFFHQAARWVELGKHPNVVNAYYVHNILGMQRLFVEYVKSKTLQQFMATEERDLETILDIAGQICWGMEHAHKRGLLHGDLRPANIFITDEREVKITDFRSRENTQLDYSPYMPPEQFDKDWPAQQTIDIYAFGAILYELCLRVIPFKIDYELKTEAALTKFKNMVLTHPLQSPHKLDSQIPQSLSQLIMECMEPNIEARPRYFTDIMARIQQIYPEVTGFPYPRKTPDPATLAAVDLNNRALSLFDLGQQEEAESLLEQAVAANPLCTGAVINLSLLRLRLGKVSLAELRTATESLIALDPEVTTFYRAKICLEKGGFIEESLTEVVRTLAKFPQNKELSRLKGILHQRLTQYDKAGEIFEELVNATDTPILQDLYYLGFCYLEKGQKEKARQLWTKGLKLYPDNAMLALALGVTLALQGKVEEAHSRFRPLVDNNSSFWANLHLAELLAAFGDYIRPYNKATPLPAEAKRLYEELLASAPRLPRLLRGYHLRLKQPLPNTISTMEDEVSPQWSYLRGLNNQSAGIHCMALSPDGRLVVTGGADKYLRIWEIATGNCKNTMEAHAGGTSQICISPDGHLIVSIGRDNQVLVWDLISGESVAKLEGHARDVTAIALTSTGYLVTGSLDRTLRVWDLGGLSCLNILKGHQDKVNCVVVTPDGKYAISGSEDTKIGIWDVESGMLVNFWEGHTDGVTCLAVSPDGKWLISGGWDQKLRVYEIATSTCMAIMEGHSGTLNCLAITPDSTLAISGGEDKMVRVWELPSGKCRHSMDGHTVDITCLALAPTSQFAVSGSWDHTLRIWDLLSGKCMGILEGHNDLVNAIAISPDERYIVSGGDDTVLRVWMDLTTLSCPSPQEPKLSYLLQRPPSQHGNLQEQRKVQKLIAQAEEKIGESQIGEAMSIYREIQKNKEFARNQRVLDSIYQAAGKGSLARHAPRDVWQYKVLKGHSGPLMCLAISPGEDVIVSGSKDHTLKLWELKEGTCIRTLEGHKAAVACVEFSPNGRFLVSGSHDKTLRLWEVETGRCIYTLEEHANWVEHAKFTPDGRRIVSGSRDNTVRIWERKTGHRLYALNSHTDLISALQITADGTLFISGSHDRSIKIGEVESGQCISTLEKHTDHVKCVACLPNSSTVASGGWDGVIYLWDLKTGESIMSFSGHESWINALAITSGGTKMVSCGLDKTLRVWDLTSGDCLAVMRGHSQDVAHIALTTDGRFCISSSWDNTLRIWDLNTYKCCNVMEGHTDIVAALQTAQNHRYIITGSKDQTVVIWEVDWTWR